VRVLGIDPGSRNTGWGVIDAVGSQTRCLGFGVIRVPADADLSVRLRGIYQELSAVFLEYGPERVVLESIFHHKSVQSALVLGHARGVALLAASERTEDIRELSPAEVKKAVTGRGRAEKFQVQEMVRLLLRLTDKPPVDASDALAVALAGARVRALPTFAIA
jgi:crossover junction endodeoxyribonuclease RuvC